MNTKLLKGNFLIFQVDSDSWDDVFYMPIRAFVYEITHLPVIGVRGGVPVARLAFGIGQSSDEPSPRLGVAVAESQTVWMKDFEQM